MCFEIPFIGLRGGCDETSNSGLYINDLPGISLIGLAAIANEEKIRGENLFRVKEQIAIMNTKRDFFNLVQKKYSFSDIITKYSSFGNYGDLVAGKCLELELTNCRRENLIIDLSYLAFFSDAAFKTELVISEDGEEVSRKTLSVIKGENILRNKIYSSAGIITLKFNTGDHNVRKITSCNCDCSLECTQCVDVKFFQTENDIREQVYWIPFNMVIYCRNNYDNLLCMYERDLAQAVWYQTGIQVMEELLVTKEINPIITNTIEDAEKLLVLWGGSDTSQFPNADKIYRQDGEYYKSLLSVVLKAKNHLENSHLKVKAHEPYLIASI